MDALDRRILEIISQNARIPFRDVAEMCNVSRAAIHQRVQKMTDMKIITGSGYHIDPKALNYHVCIYVGVTLTNGALYNSVSVEFKKISEIVECHFTTGPYTMLIKLFARDNNHFMEVLNGQIQPVPGVISTETLISLDQSINRDIPVLTESE
jgi:Lrp/AsnC family transcriptional regulator for asnA, asnC and gidA